MNYNDDLRIFVNDPASPETFIRDVVCPRDQHFVEKIDKNELFLSTVNFRLLMSLHDPEERNRWHPSVDDNKIYIGSTGFSIDLNGGVFRNDVLSIIATDRFGCPFFLKSLPEFQTTYPMLRAYAIINNLTEYARYDDQRAAEAIANHFKIDKEKPFYSIDVEKYGFCSSWVVYKALNPHEILFENANGSPVFGISVTGNNLTNEILLLPSRPIGKMMELWPVNVALMPSSPLPLFRLGDIHKRDHNPIIIAESLTLADSVKKDYGNLHDKPIVTTWFQGKDGIDHTDWSPLRDRNVSYYLPISEDHSRTEEAINTAFALYHNLYNNFDKKRLRFNIVAVDRSQRTHCYKPYDFCRLCSEFGIRRPLYIRDYIHELHDVSEITEKRSIDYLVSPIISTHTMALLFAPSAVGKSWLSMSIGMALATGKPVCSKWNVTRARNVLYVAGEMDDAEIDNRFLVLKKTYNLNAWDKDKLKYKICQKDLGQKDGQAEIEDYLEYLNSQRTHISLLILDNLNSLVANAEYKSSWDKFFVWVSRLKTKFSPLAVLIVHHTNKDGDFLGTSAIKNRLDLMIKAQSYDPVQKQIEKFSRGEGKNQLDMFISELKRDYLPEIPMYISFEKVRSLSKKQVTPFTITFNPERPDLGWIVTEPEYLKNIVTKDQDDGIPITIGDAPAAVEKKLPDDSVQPSDIEASTTEPKADKDTLDDRQNFLQSLQDGISQVDLTKKWLDFTEKEKFIVANYLREKQRLSANKIALRYGISMRTVQSALNNKKFKSQV